MLKPGHRIGNYEIEATLGDGGKDLSGSAAGVYCANLTLAGKAGWRHPTVVELMTTVDRSRPEGQRVAAVFMNSGTPYWSGSPARVAPNSLAWLVGYRHGSSDYNTKVRAYRVRCVR